MKVLFLDMDGVVNSAESAKAGVFKLDFPVDPYLAFIVGKIQLDTDCKVVLSSTWRYSPESIEQIDKQLVPIFGRTPFSTECDSKGVRGVEIKAWLDKHPEVTRYAILDDDIDMLPEQLPNFFNTSWEKGITEEIALQVTNHLNN